MNLNEMSVKDRICVKLNMICNYLREVITVNQLIGGFPPDMCQEGERLMKWHDALVIKTRDGQFTEEMEKETDELGPACIRFMLELQAVILLQATNNLAAQGQLPGGRTNPLADMVKNVLNEVKSAKDAKDGKVSVEDRSVLGAPIDPSKLN